MPTLTPNEKATFLKTSPDNSNQAISVLVIDLECTCDADTNLSPSEIIEIGAVVGTLTQEAFTVTSELQLYARPVIHTKLTEFCTQLTGITQTIVDKADSLQEVLPMLHKWLQANDVSAWTSWGKFDWNQFNRECELKALSNPMEGIKHFNLKSFFARRFGHRVGLKRALELRSLKLEGKYHSGIDDSKNIAALLATEAILRNEILKRIPSS